MPATEKKNRGARLRGAACRLHVLRAVAGAVYSALKIPAKCILIGPRHFPRGEAMAILTEGSWQTPFGEAQIDSALATALAKACPLLREDAIAHEREHSLEVQLPFLQRLGRDVRFVPVLLGTDRYADLENLGNAIAQVVAAETSRCCSSPART